MKKRGGRRGKGRDRTSRGWKTADGREEEGCDSVGGRKGRGKRGREEGETADKTEEEKGRW